MNPTNSAIFSIIPDNAKILHGAQVAGIVTKTDDGAELDVTDADVTDAIAHVQGMMANDTEAFARLFISLSINFELLDQRIANLSQGLQLVASSLASVMHTLNGDEDDDDAAASCTIN